MRCPHCDSLVEHTWVLPSTAEDDPALCEQFVKSVFEAVVKYYGEDEARRIFGPYGRQRTKREVNTENNAALFLEYSLERINAGESKRRPNVRRLALRLAKEKNADPVAMERKIWRVIKDKKVLRYLLEKQPIFSGPPLKIKGRL